MKVIDNGEGQLNRGESTIAYPDQRIDYEGWIALKYQGKLVVRQLRQEAYSFRTLKEALLPDDGSDKKKVENAGHGEGQ